ncbi:MAG: MATE family efflux transporter [Bacteroidales bacterium]|nr:MATE family efflux transporter [Bacteroidales bacterium]MCF8404027.1 MATE family efflux transporter [Bacteroidales bacterium]
MNKQILRLAIPNIISNITVPLLGMVDLAILGHMESAAYIGAIALGGLIFNFIYAIFSFLRMGTSGFTAQAFGEKNQIEITMMLGRSMFFAFAGGLLLILLQVPIDWLSFYLIEGSEEVESLAREYYYIRIYAAPASLGIMAISGWYTGMQNAKFPMAIAILINIINIGANVIFVYGFGMKSDGVAWGTLIAQYSGLTLAIILFLRKYKYLYSFWDQQEFFNWKKLGKFFKVNLDIIIRTLCLIFTFAFFTTQSAKMDDTILAVNTVLLQFLFVFSYMVDGFAYAAEALVGKFFGEQNMPNLKRSIKLLFMWGLFMSIPFTLVYLFAGDQMLYLLTDNPEVLLAASPYIFWIGIVPIVTFAAFIWDGVYIGATASAAMRNTLLISTLIVFLPTYYLLRNSMGNHGLWLAMILFMTSRGLLLTLFSKSNIFNFNKQLS